MSNPFKIEIEGAKIGKPLADGRFEVVIGDQLVATLEHKQGLWTLDNGNGTRLTGAVPEQLVEAYEFHIINTVKPKNCWDFLENEMRGATCDFFIHAVKTSGHAYIASQLFVVNSLPKEHLVKRASEHVREALIFQ